MSKCDKCGKKITDPFSKKYQELKIYSFIYCSKECYDKVGKKENKND